MTRLYPDRIQAQGICEYRQKGVLQNSTPLFIIVDAGWRPVSPVIYSPEALGQARFFNGPLCA